MSNTLTNTSALDPHDKQAEFEKLKQRIHSKLVDKLDLTHVGDMEGDVLRREIRLVVEHLCDTEDTFLNRNERDRLIDEASSYEPPMTDTPILVAMATHDCEADNKDELSFKKGDQLELHEREGEWWVASLKGRKGLVPCNYIDQITDEL